MLILQFNDCIVQTSLNRSMFKIICKPKAMVRRHLVRGYNEKVYFAESMGNAEKINQLEFHRSNPNEITKKEIYQLAGAQLVAFEADPDHIANDFDDEYCTQSLYIMDDMQKIYLLRNEDGIRFQLKKTLDFSHHKKVKEIAALRDNDWAHVHINERALSFDDSTYNFNSDLNIDITVPKYPYGEVKRYSRILDEDEEEDELKEDDNDEDDSKKSRSSSEWRVDSLQAMSMTANMIALGTKGHREFCFIVKPAPGSRRVNIVGYQQLSELNQMYFVSNTHVLLKFNGGKAVTLLSNGSIVPQRPRVQRYLEDSEVIGESQISNGKKNILLEQKYGEGEKNMRYICL